ncbi:MAG: hypothetical protein OES47_05965 [Acidobacteriota bacterium]|nr:hypothetical protein [Acidobacteriota bacterium]
MSNQEQSVELEIRRRSRELAAAWTRGRAGFVLDSLAAEEPLRAALIATSVYDTLSHWDRYDSKWPNGFRRALLARSLGSITPDESAELERKYRRRFGSSPPRPPAERPRDEVRTAKLMSLWAERIRVALATDKPLAHNRPGGPSPRFLRLQPARR